LSYRRAHEPATTGGSTTVTVCTNDLALVDLAEDRLPPVRPEGRRDFELLFCEVVELQHERVRFAAVSARTLAEKLDEEPHPFGDQGLFPAVCGRDVSLTVGEIVLAFVSRSARPAVRVPLASLAAVPVELQRRLELSTSGAAQLRWLGLLRRHEHMFAFAPDDGCAR